VYQVMCGGVVVVGRYSMVVLPTMFVSRR
jgi:hypothetical protein